MSIDVAARLPRWPAVAAWSLGWAGMVVLDERLDLANKAMVLVLSAALAAPWSGPWISLLASAAAVLAFNFAFVPPRGRFAVGLHQHALLLATLLAVSWIVALLMARLRRLAVQATLHAQRSDQLRSLGNALRAADGPAAQAAALQPLLAGLGGAPATLLLPTDDLVGAASADEAAGLQLCLRDGRAMGPGTGRHEEQPAWYLPLRGRQGTQGAALLRLAEGAGRQAGLRAHAQSLCDQLGAALERAAALQAAAVAREQAQAQALRNTLLSAIAHDHRTPLATIVSAASALHDQGDRLSASQRQRLAATIIDEAEQLTRLTDNTLQLARLESVGAALPRDWESVEEMVGAVLRRVRQRDPGRRTRARVEAGLPLLRCNAVLMVQLLDNLVDNALKHGGDGTPVELLARRVDEQLLIAVRDRGPGVPPAQRERIFDRFRQGEGAGRGAGVGLALCRAVAQAHGGELRLRARSHGGASFELWLPVEAPPP